MSENPENDSNSNDLRQSVVNNDIFDESGSLRPTASDRNQRVSPILAEESYRGQRDLELATANIQFGSFDSNRDMSDHASSSFNRDASQRDVVNQRDTTDHATSSFNRDASQREVVNQRDTTDHATSSFNREASVRDATIRETSQREANSSQRDEGSRTNSSIRAFSGF